MLAQIGVNRFNFVYSNIGAVALANVGTSVTPGASDVEGSWTQVASSSNIIQDIYIFSIFIAGAGTAGQIKNQLLDIGVDQAGGTSYVAVIENAICGGTDGASSGGKQFIFPLFIKSGSSVAVRVQGNNATAGTVRVIADFYGQPSHPELVKVGQYAETIGTITNSAGVSVTPGNSGAEGSWVSLGTLVRGCWWFQVGVQCTNDTINAVAYHFDLAYGDTNNKHMIIQDFRIATATNELIKPVPAAILNCCADLPSGTEIWIRGTCSTTTDTGWNAAVVAVGG